MNGVGRCGELNCAGEKRQIHNENIPNRNAFLAFEGLGMPGIPQALLIGMNTFDLRNVFEVPISETQECPFLP